MTYHNLISEIKSIKAGTVFNIMYQTELPMSAKCRKQGYSVIKVTSKLARTGVKYQNIKGVVPSDSPRNSNLVPVVENRIYENTVNGTQYIRLARWGKPCATSIYILYKDGEMVRNISKEEAMDYTIPSYWKETGEVPAVILVKLSNIISIRMNRVSAKEV